MLIRPLGTNFSETLIKIFWFSSNKMHCEMLSAKCVSFCSLLNPSPPSAAYMRWWIGSTLVQIIACHLFGAKPLSKPMLGIVNWTLGNKLQWNSNQNTKLFIHENAFENIVCEMAAFCLGLDVLMCGLTVPCTMSLHIFQTAWHPEDVCNA